MKASKSIDVETFVMGDSLSIRALKPNGPDEEISPQSYLQFLQEYVERMGGVADQADLEAELEAHFRKVWGQADLRPVLSLRGRVRLKWQNNLDWAKVMARKADPPIFAKTIRRKKSGTLRVLVRIDENTDPEWLELVSTKRKRTFTKRCPKCRKKVKLSAPFCPRCLREFPDRARRKHKLPR